MATNPKAQEARDETRAQEKGRRQEEVVAGLQLSPLVSHQGRQIFYSASHETLPRPGLEKGQQYIRIVRLERLEVEYKSIPASPPRKAPRKSPAKKISAACSKARICYRRKKSSGRRMKLTPRPPRSNFGNCNAPESNHYATLGLDRRCTPRKSAPPTACWPSSFIPT
jgi:hypothetical protein